MPIDPELLAPDGDATLALREWMPWWVERFALPTYLSCCFVIAYLVTRVVLRLQPGYRALSSDLHWVERAQLGHPARVASTRILFPLAVLVTSLGLVLQDDLLVTTSTVPWCIPGLLALVVGWLLGHGPFERRLGVPSGTIMSLLRALALALLLFGPTIAIGLSALFLAPVEPVWQALLWLAVVALVLIPIQQGHALRLAKPIRLVRDADERVCELLDRAMEKTGVRDAQILVMPGVLPAAYALPWLRQVVLVGPILELGNEALESVIRHELGHVGESRSVKWQRTLGVFPLTVLFGLNLWTHLFGWWVALGIIAASFFAIAAVKRRSVRWEVEADGVATADSSDEEKAIYAGALEWLHERSLSAVVMPKRGVKTHPDLVDRMRAAGVEPEWEVPGPARRSRFALALSFVLASLLAFVAGLGHAVLIEPGSTLGRATTGMSYDDLALELEEEMDDDRRAALLAVRAQRWDSAIDAYAISGHLATAGDTMNLAQVWFAEAESRSSESEDDPDQLGEWRDYAIESLEWGEANGSR